VAHFGIAHESIRKAHIAPGARQARVGTLLEESPEVGHRRLFDGVAGVRAGSEVGVAPTVEHDQQDLLHLNGTPALRATSGDARI
jgi:hypothetical protein